MSTAVVVVLGGSAGGDVVVGGATTVGAVVVGDAVLGGAWVEFGDVWGAIVDAVDPFALAAQVLARIRTDSKPAALTAA